MDDNNTRHIQQIHVHTASERAFLVVCTASYYELYYCTLPRCHRRPHSSVPEVSRTYSTKVFAVTSMLARHASGMYDFISLALFSHHHSSHFHAILGLPSAHLTSPYRYRTIVGCSQSPLFCTIAA
jgi:hypothetical protein